MIWNKPKRTTLARTTHSLSVCVTVRLIDGSSLNWFSFDIAAILFNVPRHFTKYA